MKTQQHQHNQHHEQQPDVATILQSLREEIQAQRQQRVANDPYHAAHQALDDQLRQCAEQLEITRVVSSQWPLTGHTVPQRIIVLFNKLVRRYLRWYIDPIVHQQNEFNDVAARTLRLLIEAHGEVREQIITLHTDANTDTHTSQQVPNSKTPSNPSNAHTDNYREATAVQLLIEQQAAHEPPAPLHDIALRSYPKKLRVQEHVSAHWQLHGETLFQQAMIVVHKLVRRYLRWLINPIVEQQNACNHAIANTIEPLIDADGEARAMVAAYRVAKHPPQQNQ